MKVLLLGEFSALHRDLCDGLLALGHDARVASTGDGWKAIPTDIMLGSNAPGLKGRLARLWSPLASLPKLINHDVIQFINPVLFSTQFGYNEKLIRMLFAQNNKSFLVAAGCDAFYWNEGRQRLPYGPFADFEQQDLGGNSSPWRSPVRRKFNQWLAENVDGIIPIMYDYWVGYQGFPNLCSPLPIPVNLEKIKYQENTLKQGKLVVFHGLNREGFKGTGYVRKAFDILSSKYPGQVECVIQGRMPLKDYMKLLSTVNVVVDQTSSHGSGVNGLFSLALGKVVLGGNEPAHQALMYGDDPCPIRNISQDPMSIVAQVEQIMAQRDQLAAMGQAGREFIMRHHDHRRVAARYVDTWQMESKK